MSEIQTGSPLAGIKILDFSTLLPGPYASKMLQDMGAEVIRIEAPDRPDLVRFMPPFVDGESTSHRLLNSGKKSVALDLKKPQSVELIKSIVDQYDIVIEQFRPGVMAKFGLDYDSLKAIHPGLIYCSITGYGQIGPLAQRAGHDINYLALAGAADYSRRSGEKPTPYSIQVADIAGGSHHAVMAILAALYQRDAQKNSQANGEPQGQYLDIAMADAVLAMNGMAAASALGGDDIQPQQQILHAKSYYDFYETKDGRYFSVGSLEPKFITGLCQVIGQPHMVGKAISQRPEDITEFKQLLTDFFLQRDFDTLEQIFAPRDLCVEPVVSLSQALAHPHFIKRGMIKTGPCGGELGSPLPFSSPTPSETDTRTLDKLGQSTTEFLQQHLFSDADIQQLKQDGAIK